MTLVTCGHPPRVSVDPPLFSANELERGETLDDAVLRGSEEQFGVFLKLAKSVVTPHTQDPTHALVVVVHME